MFGKISKKDTIIGGDCVLESNLQTAGNLKISGKINGFVKAQGDVTVCETGVVLGDIYANNLTISGTVEGTVYCKNTLKLTSSSKLSGDAHVKKFTSEEGCLFAGKCVMEELENLMKKGKTPDKNFDMTAPNGIKKPEIISELENTEKPQNTESTK